MYRRLQGKSVVPRGGAVGYITWKLRIHSDNKQKFGRPVIVTVMCRLISSILRNAIDDGDSGENRIIDTPECDASN